MGTTQKHHPVVGYPQNFVDDELIVGVGHVTLAAVFKAHQVYCEAHGIINRRLTPVMLYGWLLEHLGVDLRRCLRPASDDDTQQRYVVALTPLSLRAGPEVARQLQYDIRGILRDEIADAEREGKKAPQPKLTAAERKARLKAYRREYYQRRRDEILKQKRGRKEKQK